MGLDFFRDAPGLQAERREIAESPPHEERRPCQGGVSEQMRARVDRHHDQYAAPSVRSPFSDVPPGEPGVSFEELERVDPVTAWSGAMDASWSMGREQGYRLGWLAGHKACEDEYEASWAGIARRIRAGANEPAFAELEQLRSGQDHEPCSRPGCHGRCAQCVSAESYRSRGGRPFLGVAIESLLSERGAA